MVIYTTHCRRRAGGRGPDGVRGAGAGGGHCAAGDDGGDDGDTGEEGEVMAELLLNNGPVTSDRFM